MEKEEVARSAFGHGRAATPLAAAAICRERERMKAAEEIGVKGGW